MKVKGASVMNAHSQKPQKTTRAINGVLDQILGYARRIAAKSETVGASGWPRTRTLNGHTVLKAIAPIVAGSAAENFLERLDAMALIGETRYLGQGVVGDFPIEMRGDVVVDATSHTRRQSAATVLYCKVMTGRHWFCSLQKPMRCGVGRTTLRKPVD